MFDEELASALLCWTWSSFKHTRPLSCWRVMATCPSRVSPNVVSLALRHCNNKRTLQQGVCLGGSAGAKIEVAFEVPSCHSTKTSLTLVTGAWGNLGSTLFLSMWNLGGCCAVVDSIDLVACKM